MRAVSVLFLPVAAWAAANANAPHPHTGLLSKYQAKTPESYGISLAGATAEQLRSGKPTVRFIDTGGGNKRVVSIQDIRAPEELVWRIITDLPNYSKMVEGCELCERYGEVEQLPDGGRVECAKYRIGAVGFKMEYFIKHTFEPEKHCFTFHLDYDKGSSDLSDTVGYWYVEQLDDGWCRVYYSTDSVLPSWIPGFAKKSIVNVAARTATAWVDVHCRIAQEAIGACGGLKQTEEEAEEAAVPAVALPASKLRKSWFRRPLVLTLPAPDQLLKISLLGWACRGHREELRATLLKLLPFVRHVPLAKLVEWMARKLVDEGIVPVVSVSSRAAPRQRMAAAGHLSDPWMKRRQFRSRLVSPAGYNTV